MGKFDFSGEAHCLFEKKNGWGSTIGEGVERRIIWSKPGKRVYDVASSSCVAVCGRLVIYFPEV